MNKTKKFLAMALSAMMVLSLAGCAGNTGASGSSAGTSESAAPASSVAAPAAAGVKNTAGYAKDEYNLVFVPKLVHEWYEEVRVGIDQAVAELAEKGVKVNVEWNAPADAIVSDQIVMVEAAAAKNPDGISMAIIDPAATTQVINELIANGINVSTFDCDAPDSQRIYYCGHSKNYDDGFEMGERLAKALGESGEVAILAGTLSAGNHQERVQGFKAAIAKYPNMKIVAEQADNDSIETAIEVTEGFISTYPNLKGLIGVNAASPIGSARAITDANLAGKILIVGMAEDQEAMQLVKSGTILCTLRQAVPTYGYNSVMNMLLIADGKAPNPAVDEIPAHFVTAENVDEFLTK